MIKINATALWPTFSRKVASGAVYLLLMGVSVFTALPLLFQAIGSLRYGLGAYGFLIGQADFMLAVRNSVLVATSGTGLQLLVCSLGGYGFAKHYVPFGRVLFGLLVGLMFIPIGVILLPMFLLIRDLHWIDTFRALVVPGAANAFGLFFMRQYISSIPNELLDAARIDGAGEFTIFRRVVLPVIAPGLITLGLISLVTQWNSFMWPLVMLQLPGNFTLPLYMARLGGPLAMAASVIALIPMLAVFLLFQHQIMESVTTGAIVS